MSKQELPKRHYCTGEKKLSAFRVHKRLLNEMKKIADDKGWDITAVALLAMDEYVVAMKKKKRGGQS
ncbi:MAG: hypothetical protein IT288_05655 [Bdellovibrionales bacterium]|nr:hypothetical protein [Bdellovibrionales bacterium]